MSCQSQSLFINPCTLRIFALLCKSLSSSYLEKALWRKYHRFIFYELFIVIIISSHNSSRAAHVALSFCLSHMKLSWQNISRHTVGNLGTSLADDSLPLLPLPVILCTQNFALNFQTKSFPKSQVHQSNSLKPVSVLTQRLQSQGRASSMSDNSNHSLFFHSPWCKVHCDGQLMYNRMIDHLLWLMTSQAVRKLLYKIISSIDILSATDNHLFFECRSNLIKMEVSQ